MRMTPKSRHNYQGAYKRYLSPALGAKELHQVTKMDLVDALQPLPPHSQYQTLMAIRALLKEAVYRELLDDNVAMRIKAPKVQSKPKQFLTIEFVMSTDFGRHTDTVRFLALHGLRWGEFVSLTPEDIHDGRVFVERSMYGPTKTPAGVRSVPYMGFYPAVKPSRTSLIRALAKHGVNIHSLRKTYAYGLKASGVHVTTAAKLMGHTNPLVTMKIYTGVLDTEVDDAGTALRDKFLHT